MEKDEFEFSYSVKYVNPNVNLNIRQRVSNDKHLELYWDKPQIEGTEIESYTVYNYNNFEDVVVSKITNPYQTSFVDNDYIYGSKTYRIVTKYKLDKIAEKEDFYTVKYDQFNASHFLFNVSNTGSLLLSWTNPNEYACKYILEDSKGNKSKIEQDISNFILTEYVFPQDKDLYFKLHILPIDGDYYDYAEYPNVVFAYKDKNLGYSHSGDLVYDSKNKLLLGLTPYQPQTDHFVNAYDMTNDFKLTNSYSTQETGDYDADQIHITRANKIGLYYRSWGGLPAQFTVFSDYTLKNKISRINLPSDQSYPHHYLTDNDRYFLNEDNNNLNIYDINTGNRIVRKYESGNLSAFGTAVSISGKYVFNASSSRKSYNLYEFDGRNLTLIKNSSNFSFKSYHVSPLNDKHAIVAHFDNTFSIINVPEMTTITKISGNFICFDPVTGNILYTEKAQENNYHIKIRNNTFNKDIFQIITKNDGLQLINSYLFYNKYNYINISNALQQ